MSFYSSVELTSVSCVASLFLIEKILINVCILRNPSRFGILFISGLYRLGLIVRRKPFPFRVT